MSYAAELNQINHALDLAEQALDPYTPGQISATFKQGNDPLTAADLAVDAALREALAPAGYGWLSEESSRRNGGHRTWVVDPIDGTREFVAGIPEWCVSVGLVDDGVAIAGGILNPATQERIVGALGQGVIRNGEPVSTTSADDLRGALVLASRSEVKRGEWNRFFTEDFAIRNMGSVAYKLALVAAGRADATWTLVPKHEWDVAAGAALVRAAGGTVVGLDGHPPEFGKEDPRLDGFIAAAPGIAGAVLEILGIEG